MLHVGSKVQRTKIGSKDNTDGFMDIIRGATFEITRINEGFVDAIVSQPNADGYPQIGAHFSIPFTHLENPNLFILAIDMEESQQPEPPDHQDKRNGGES